MMLQKQPLTPRNPPPLTSPLSAELTTQDLSRSRPPPLHAPLPYLITRHYAATSAIHAQTGSAPQQKSGSQQPDATAQPSGPAPQHRRCHPPPYRRHRCPDQRRPTSAYRTAGPGEVAPGARPVRVRTLEVEAAAVVAAAAAVAASVVETEFEIAAIAAVAGAAVVAVVEGRVPRETRR
jgi:hypothetical protein